MGSGVHLLLENSPSACHKHETSGGTDDQQGIRTRQRSKPYFSSLENKSRIIKLSQLERNAILWFQLTKIDANNKSSKDLTVARRN